MEAEIIEKQYQLIEKRWNEIWNLYRQMCQGAKAELEHELHEISAEFEQPSLARAYQAYSTSLNQFLKGYSHVTLSGDTQRVMSKAQDASVIVPPANGIQDIKQIQAKMSAIARKRRSRMIGWLLGILTMLNLCASPFLLFNAGLIPGLALLLLGIVLVALTREYYRAKNESESRYTRYLINLREQWERIIKQQAQAKEIEARQRYQQALGRAEKVLRAGIRNLQVLVAEFTAQADRIAPPWNAPVWSHWEPPDSVIGIVRLGTTHLTIPQKEENYYVYPRHLDISQIEELHLVPQKIHNIPDIRFPALIPFPQGKPLRFDGTDSDTIRSFLLRLLTSIPPGQLRFTFIDPIGLGQNVAPFIHLADYDEQLITGKVWTDPQHIEQQLASLTGHMENIIQQYLRDQYATIEDYNAQAGELTEPYRVLVIFDFPTNFSDTSKRHLQSIIRNGPRCGIYAIMERSGPLYRWLENPFGSNTSAEPDPPEPELFSRIVATVGQAAKKVSKVEVPFERITPPKAEWWTGNSAQGLHTPLGLAGVRKTQSLSLGPEMAQHALVVGKINSGKSTLLHILITSLSLTYSPGEVELYLIDFKKGVEFKTYAVHQLPHARVIAIESEREFGLSVLQGLNAELHRRGDLFRAAGAEHIASYRQKTGQKLPRILLLVDEFQEFFAEDDAIASQALQLLDRLVRQGRAFGIHIVLSSQTLAGTYTLARSTIDQMAARIALQCSEADSRLILADDNPAARFLSRPGEAIYNDANGLVEGNTRFQVAWLPADQRDHYLAQIRELARQRKYRPPHPQIVFEGNALARVEDNRRLNDLLAAPTWPTSSRDTLAWLGDPVAIRAPVAAVFRRQSGNNLLIVGQNDQAALNMITVTLISLAAQHPPQDTAFYILGFGPYAGLWNGLAQLLPHSIKVGRRRQLPDFIGELAAEVQYRLDNEQPHAPSRYLLIYGLQKARDLHQEEMGLSDFGSFGAEPSAPNPAQQFATILREGPDLGIHTIAWCNTVTNLNRSLDRRTWREFTMRVAFQMSTEDSVTLMDTPAASKLGPYRAIFYEEEENRLEKLRPYDSPSGEWVKWAIAQIQRKKQRRNKRT